MTWPIPDPTATLLVVARIAGLVMTAPLLGHMIVPLRVRIGIVGALALAIAPAAARPIDATIGLLPFAGLIGMETLIGAVIGFVAQLVFAGIQLGGQVAGVQIGFGMASLLDPESAEQSTVVAEWHQLLALLAYLALDVHHVLISAIVESFRVAPAGAAILGAGTLRGVALRAGDIFAISVRIAAPALIVLLLVNATLGVLARTIPQLNVFVVGFPLNVTAGLVVLGASLPFTFRFLAEQFATLGPTLGWVLRGVAHG